MSFKRAKMKWAKKLLKAKMFVILTDKESAIAIDGVDPHSFTDALALAAQAAELQLFHEQLGDLLKEHAAALKVLSGVPDEKPIKKAPATNRKDSGTTKAGRGDSKQRKAAVRKNAPKAGNKA